MTKKNGKPKTYNTALTFHDLTSTLPEPTAQTLLHWLRARTTSALGALPPAPTLQPQPPPRTFYLITPTGKRIKL